MNIPSLVIINRSIIKAIVGRSGQIVFILASVHPGRSIGILAVSLRDQIIRIQFRIFHMKRSILQNRKVFAQITE